MLGMAADLSPRLMQILQSTLREVERELHEPESDAVLRELKQQIVRAITELEVERDTASRRIVPADSADGSS
jgi:hypothetical protein